VAHHFQLQAEQWAIVSRAVPGRGVRHIRRYSDLWSPRGAKFITEPKVHASEIRCYIRDPDGYLIEVGQTTTTEGPLDMYA